MNNLARMSELEVEREKETRAFRKSPFKKFYQTNTEGNSALLEDWLINQSPTAYRILKFLVTHMDNYNAIIVSNKVLQKYFSLSKSTVIRAIKLLNEHNFIKTLKSGTSNVYLINKTLYWNSWGSNWKYAEFDTKIIIDLSEQSHQIQEEILADLKIQRRIISKQVDTAN